MQLSIFQVFLYELQTRFVVVINKLTRLIDCRWTGCKESSGFVCRSLLFSVIFCCIDFRQ